VATGQADPGKTQYLKMHHVTNFIQKKTCIPGSQVFHKEYFFEPVKN